MSTLWDNYLTPYLRKWTAGGMCCSWGLTRKEWTTLGVLQVHGMLGEGRENVDTSGQLFDTLPQKVDSRRHVLFMVSYTQGVDYSRGATCTWYAK